MLSFFVRLLLSRLYSLIIFLAVVVGFLYVRRSAKDHQVSLDDVDNLFWLAVPLGILGARLYHVLTDWHLYKDNLVGVFYIWQGGLGIYGALIGGGMGLFLYARIKQLNLLNLLDLVAPALALGQGIGRWGNIINGELLPYAYYESAWDFLVFLVLLKWGRFFPRQRSTAFEIRKDRSLPKTVPNRQGFLFALYGILYGGGRFFWEFLRSEAVLFMGLKLNQLVSLGLVAMGVLIVVRTVYLRRSELY